MKPAQTIDEQIQNLRIAIRNQVGGNRPTAEQDEILRCCNVALDRRFGEAKTKAAREACAAAINARSAK